MKNLFITLIAIFFCFAVNNSSFADPAGVTGYVNEPQAECGAFHVIENRASHSLVSFSERLGMTPVTIVENLDGKLLDLKLDYAPKLNVYILYWVTSSGQFYKVLHKENDVLKSVK